MTRNEIKKQFEKTMRMSAGKQQQSEKFDSIIREYYGDVHYSDRDKDEIIDVLDYGLGIISFETFDKIMIEINEEGDES